MPIIDRIWQVFESAISSVGLRLRPTKSAAASRCVDLLVFEGVPANAPGVPVAFAFNTQASGLNDALYAWVGSAWTPAELDATSAGFTDTSSWFTTDTMQGLADGVVAAIGGTSQGVRNYATNYVLVDNDSAFTALSRLDAAFGDTLANLDTTAKTLVGAIDEVKGIADAALPTASDLLVTAVIAVADAPGGATDSALTVQLKQLAGANVGSEREVLIVCSASTDQYRPYMNPPDIGSVTFGTATVGAIVASGGGWALVRTDADGAFACTATNSGDEGIYFSVVTAEGISSLSYKCLVSGCVPDLATWSA